MRRFTVPTVLAAAALALAAGSATAAPPAPHTERISVSATGEQGDAVSQAPIVSANGRYAAFSSAASNLVPDDTNGTFDVFVRDLRTDTIERVSVASDGTPGSGTSRVAAISGNGRYVVFRSDALNLVPDAPDGPYGSYDVYVHDRRTGTTELASVTPGGVTAHANWTADISDDGRYVAFNAWPAPMESGPLGSNPAVYLHDRETGTTERVSNRERPTYAAYDFDLSGNGRHLAYSQNDVRSTAGLTYVRDLRTGSEEQVNVTPEGAPSARSASAPRLSANGRTVTFESRATDLVPGSEGPSATLIYVRNLRTGTTSRVPHDGAGATGAGGAALSADGRHLAYLVSAYEGDNVYVRDLRTGETVLASVTVDGGPVTDHSFILAPSLDAHGRTVGFSGYSARFVPGDTNGQYDAFVRRLR
ncbi:MULTISPECIES: hypothetical protein [unclassified Streptomyces]|uniref:hypothetical protein n=1 Tax=unclassified Streptomyces TaxID=2593676 RepID=UPI00278C3F85|nr:MULTISPECIES: hypothetical protein [unclassified Streptomyces]